MKAMVGKCCVKQKHVSWVGGDTDGMGNLC